MACGDEKSRLLGHTFGELQYCCYAAEVTCQDTYTSWISRHGSKTVEELKTLLAEQQEFASAEYGIKERPCLSVSP